MLGSFLVTNEESGADCDNDIMNDSTLTLWILEFCPAGDGF